MFKVEAIGVERADELHRLRLQALRQDPDAFLSTYDEEAGTGVDLTIERMRRGAGDPAYGVFVAELNATLVGMVGCARAPRTRQAHKAFIWGMWVAPEARRRGIARALMTAALQRLRAAGDIELVHLSVTNTQPEARALYADLGFTRWGTEIHAMKLGDRYLDEEHLVLELAQTK